MAPQTNPAKRAVDSNFAGENEMDEEQEQPRPWTNEEWFELKQIEFECDVACYESCIAMGCPPEKLRKPKAEHYAVYV